MGKTTRELVCIIKTLVTFTGNLLGPKNPVTWTENFTVPLEQNFLMGVLKSCHDFFSPSSSSCFVGLMAYIPIEEPTGNYRQRFNYVLLGLLGGVGID